MVHTWIYEQITNSEKRTKMTYDYEPHNCLMTSLTLSWWRQWRGDLNKRLTKQSRGWWFQTPSQPLWRHFNGYALFDASTRKMLSNVYKRQTRDKENTSTVWNIHVFRYNFMEIVKWLVITAILLSFVHAFVGFFVIWRPLNSLRPSGAYICR